MHQIIRKGIVDILKKHEELLPIALRQRAKFEGWLKFELACYLDQIGMRSVEVESQSGFGRERADIAFFKDDEPFSIELKTPNTSWEIPGVNSSGKPISKNIKSIINDAFKLNSESGIIAFVLFPVPIDDIRWEVYLERISQETGLCLSKEKNCEVVKKNIDDKHECELIVCSFMTKRFRKLR